MHRARTEPSQVRVIAFFVVSIFEPTGCLVVVVESFFHDTFRIRKASLQMISFFPRVFEVHRRLSAQRIASPRMPSTLNLHSSSFTALAFHTSRAYSSTPPLASASVPPSLVV
jgi:hypothetical protein